MVVSLVENFYAARLHKLPEAVDNVRGVFFHLLKHDATHAVRDLELAVSPVDELKNRIVGRNVGLAGHFLHDGAVFIVVEVIIVLPYLEDRVPSQPLRLVKLEIKADAYHFSFGFLIGFLLVWIFYWRKFQAGRNVPRNGRVTF